jgi:DnaJ-class molecular chaperone
MTPRQGLTAPAMDRHPAKSHDPEARTDDQPARHPNAVRASCPGCGGRGHLDHIEAPSEFAATICEVCGGNGFFYVPLPSIAADAGEMCCICGDEAVTRSEEDAFCPDHATWAVSA